MMDLENIWETVIAVLLAVAGGFARLLNVKNKSKVKWTRIASEVFVSGFAGLMVLLVARASGLSGSWLGVLSGMSGWIGPRALDAVAKLAGNAAGINLKNDNREDNQDEH